MKNSDGRPYKVGQNLLHRVGKKLISVTFVSLGPRVGRTVGKDTVTNDSQVAIVRDGDGNLLTVKLTDLQPAPSN